jgi:dihydroorotase
VPVTIPVPDDFHVHLRTPPLLEPVVRATAGQFGRVLVMPNVVPPVTDVQRLESYRREIRAALPPGEELELLMTFKLLPSVSPATVEALAAAGAVGGKLYPAGVTTNSADGVTNLRDMRPQLEAMEACGLVLEIHGELPGAFVLDREEAFLPELEWVVSEFPGLRVVLEHVTSRAAVRAVSEMPERVGATITAHHLLVTLDDLLGDCLRPHLFCKPVAKREEDRQALLEAVFSGSRKFFFGSDSAPHHVDDKESDCGCAGVYTAPVALAALARLFSDHGVPLADSGGDGASLERFACQNGAMFYDLPTPAGSVTLTEEPWTVPDRYGDLVPFLAGEELPFRVRKTGGII